jgi:hypothetical protein
MLRGLAAALVLCGAALAQGVQPGDQPEYSFRQPVLNGEGMKSLADLRGKPLLVEFWGTR